MHSFNLQVRGIQNMRSKPNRKHHSKHRANTAKGVEPVQTQPRQLSAVPHIIWSGTETTVFLKKKKEEQSASRVR